MAVIERRIGLIERRFSTSPVAARRQAARRAGAAKQDAKTLGGLAAVFDEETVIMGLFREVIRPGAFKASIAADDVVGLFNHDANFILGRTDNGTVRLSEDSQGLQYEIDLNAADFDAMRIGAIVARGDITGSSFAFTVEDDAGEAWDFGQTKKGLLPLRTILRARLFDVSPVTNPAYASTTVSANSANSQARYDVPLEDLERALELDELELLLHRGRRTPARYAVLELQRVPAGVSLEQLERENARDFARLSR